LLNKHVQLLLLWVRDNVRSNRLLDALFPEIDCRVIHFYGTCQSQLASLITVVSAIYFGPIAAFYSPRELVFTRNKLIVFTTSRELSHYVVFS